jgi:acyl-CoA thioesterase
MALHPLDEGTAFSRLEADRFAVQLTPLFWGTTAAHGGYLAATLLRAMTERVNDAERHIRSLSTFFLQGPKQGTAEVHTELLRTGGKISQLNARLVQDGSVTTFAVATFGKPFEGEDLRCETMPELRAPEQYARLAPSKVEIDQRFEHRQCFGDAPFTAAPEARIGGFSRFTVPREIDAASLTVLCDAWWPALFPTLANRKRAGACPTLDLTIHFRTSLPLPYARADDFVVIDLRSTLLHEGYLDERGTIWSMDGQLLAQSVQHAARLLPRV